MAESSNSMTSILFALGANIAIFSAKLAAALYTGSGAMLAEAIHSLADSGNQLLLIVGLRGAKRPPNDEHPLGYGKTIYFWSFIVALILFSMGGMFSVYEGVHKILHPEPLTAPWLAIAVLVFSISQSRFRSGAVCARLTKPGAVAAYLHGSKKAGKASCWWCSAKTSPPLWD